MRARKPAGAPRGVPTGVSDRSISDEGNRNAIEARERPMRRAWLWARETGRKTGDERCGWDEVCAVPEKEFMLPVKSYYLFYYSFMRPSFRDFCPEDGGLYHADIIDTWNMTVTGAGDHRGKFRISLPARPYMAVRLFRID